MHIPVKIFYAMFRFRIFFFFYFWSLIWLRTWKIYQFDMLFYYRYTISLSGNDVDTCSYSFQYFFSINVCCLLISLINMTIEFR